MNFITPSVLTTVFQSFYEEILRQKERALRETEVGLQLLTPALVKDRFANDSMNETPQDLDNENTEEDEDLNSIDEGNNRALCNTIQRHLRIFMEEHSLKINYQLGEFGRSNFKEAMYIMAAMADEVFLTLGWPGRNIWQKNLLETQFFQTQIAGELFFDRLDALLASPDSVKNELAMLYLLSLSLGFRGKYSQHDDLGKIQWYKKQLFHMLNHHTSDLYQPGRKHMANAPYEHNFTLPPAKSLPDVRSWVFTMGGVVGMYFFVTYILWYKVVRDIDEALQFIFEQARMLPL